MHFRKDINTFVYKETLNSSWCRFEFFPIAPYQHFSIILVYPRLIKSGPTYRITTIEIKRHSLILKCITFLLFSIFSSFHFGLWPWLLCNQFLSSRLVLFLWFDNVLVLQVQGLWKLKNQNMADLCKVAKELKDRFLSFEIRHVERVISITPVCLLWISALFRSFPSVWCNFLLFSFCGFFVCFPSRGKYVMHFYKLSFSFVQFPANLFQNEKCVESLNAFKENVVLIAMSLHITSKGK